MSTINEITDEQRDAADATRINFAYCGHCDKHEAMTERGHVLRLPHERVLLLECEVCAVCGTLCYALLREEGDSDEGTEGDKFVVLDWTVDPPRMLPQ